MIEEAPMEARVHETTEKISGSTLVALQGKNKMNQETEKSYKLKHMWSLN
jgi:hypothetical protein